MQGYNLVNITVTSKTVADGNGIETTANQLYKSKSLCLSCNTDAIYIADVFNHRLYNAIM
jgi:hypothetical protein